MEAGGTAALREGAARWSLAGDRRLLDSLQNLHQRIISKCQETNKNLEEMVTTLDDASVNLQNVNNKFIALSNTQFIESRVYDDDADITTHTTPKKEVPLLDAAGELERLRDSLRVLVGAHDTVAILRDSDSDSDSDDDVTSVVLKPKDMYAARPLPHIIGSLAWKAKWHAGLLAEDSDTDSSTCKREGDRELYSDSEEEMEHLTVPERTISTSSSEQASSRVAARAACPSPSPSPSPADVAAALARRLGGVPRVPSQEPEESPPTPTVRKVYKPEKPAPGAIFSDEPPPLPSDQSEAEASDDDIFAELHKNKPYSNTDRDHHSLTEDLFGGQSYGGGKVDRDLFDEFSDVPKSQVPTKPVAKPKSTLFEDEHEPELFAAKPTTEQPQAVVENENSTKKPVGAISLFGNNKNNESIGAAILKRNQRKSSTSAEDSESDTDKDAPKPKRPAHVTKNLGNPIKNDKVEVKSRDIFDDLFAKSEKQQKNATQKKETVVKVDKKPEKSVDLFSDNLFDDIDDIFTTNIVTKVTNDTKKPQKSLFDDTDDLFSDIAVTKPTKVEVVKDSNTSIFDSDDDLFSEKTKNIKDTDKQTIQHNVNSASTKTSKVISKVDVSETKAAERHSLFNEKDDHHLKTSESTKINELTNVKNIVTKGLFDDSDDDLFSNSKITKSVPVISKSNVKISKETSKHDFDVKISKENYDKSKMRDISKTLESDLFSDEDDNLFSNTNAVHVDKTKVKSVVQTPFRDHKTDGVRSKLDELNAKPDIFGEDKIDDLFVNANKSLEKAASTMETVKERQPLVAEDSNRTKIHNKSEFSVENTNSNEVVDENITKSNAKDDIFDTDILEDDIFSKTNTEDKMEPVSVEEKPSQASKEITNDSSEENEWDDGLFTSSSKNNVASQYIDKDCSINNTEIGPTPALLSQHTTDSITSKTITESSPKLDRDEPTATVTKKTEPNVEPVQNAKTTDSKPKDTDKDIFRDVFVDQPPIFEKPKEPKRSKNVNALFDDDSDDEALFFRKSDVTEEVIDDFTPADKEDAVFGIFVDEPPAIDVDFVQKSEKIDNAVDKTLVFTLDHTETDGEIFVGNQNVIKTDGNSQQNDQNKSEFNDDEIFSKTNKDKIGSESTKNQLKEVTVSAQDNLDLANTKSIQEKATISPKTDTTDGNSPTETKKVGKLKPMNININVNSLLPGASPKKTLRTPETTEQIDGNISAKSNEELHFTDKEVESKLVKSVSFDGDPESLVLDNKLSKDRAKIQIKRRPSTRRARREAAKKSGIDFGEDSTDNSSSVDDAPKTAAECLEKGNNDRENTIDTKSTDFDDQKEVYTRETSAEITNDNVAEVVSSRNTNEIASEDIKNADFTNTSASKDVKSKIVYIINDDDIFTNTKTEEVKPNKPLLNIVDDNDDIFKSMATQNQSTNNFRNQNVTAETKTKEAKTITNSDSAEDLFRSAESSRDKRKETGEKLDKKQDKTSKKRMGKTKPSIFDDLSDEENALFNTKSKSKSHKNKSALFDSDSDEELFGSKREAKSVEREIVKPVKREIKRPNTLFGDDDEDDLFNVKTKNKPEPKPQPKTSTKEITTSQAVFDDPLSLLGDDD